MRDGALASWRHRCGRAHMIFTIFTRCAARVRRTFRTHAVCVADSLRAAERRQSEVDSHVRACERVICELRSGAQADSVGPRRSDSGSVCAPAASMPERVSDHEHMSDEDREPGSDTQYDFSGCRGLVLHQLTSPTPKLGPLRFDSLIIWHWVR